MPAYADPDVAEYVRRQRLADIDLRAFKAELSAKFPGQPFLIIRYGDHLPFIGGKMLEPKTPEAEVWKKIDALDPRYFTAYLAVDTVNYQPVQPMPKPEVISASYLGLLLFKLTGIPMNPAAQYQATIFDRCDGLFIECDGGEAMRRFNGWLTKNGLATGL